MNYRTEKDTLGIVKVPKDAYWGAQTERARRNFPVSGLRLPPVFIWAQAIVKEAAAMANENLGRLPKKYARAIIAACRDIREGMKAVGMYGANPSDFFEGVRRLSARSRPEKKSSGVSAGQWWQGQFVVDIYSAGAGTSQNMNINEVVANRANELLGVPKGSYRFIHPNDHVNLGQSTNDTVPTALYIACYEIVHTRLLPSLFAFEQALHAKAREFRSIKKTGRTHLQDALPLTLGNEFVAFSATIAYHRKCVARASTDLLALNLGGTAVGSGVNAGPVFRKIAIKKIRRLTQRPFVSNPNLFAGTQNVDAAISISSTLRNLSIALGKIASDLRLLASGPASGFNEISLPSVQPGSSIMPAKVNPSIPEMVNMVCFQIMGLDQAVASAGQAAQLELNVMTPLIAFNVLHELEILNQAIHIFTEKCVKGIKANAEQCRRYYEGNPVIATALTPRLGYARVAELITEAYATGRSIREVILAHKLLSEKEINNLLQ